ncbi:MAG: DNA repair protein RecO [Solirubrobacterales bacterium]|nr:DNA repair protein RecO [Solirubrobacterales bacterium]
MPTFLHLDGGLGVWSSELFGTICRVGKTFKTEAVVLRSIRFGEADRVLHLYSLEHGRIGAIAKGVRKPRSRFGGRLEPFFRLALVLHRGRSDLHTVSAAETVAGHGTLRSSGRGIAAGADACGAVLKLLDGSEPNPPAYNLLCRFLDLVDQDPEADLAGPAGTVAFRLKLALAAGFAPELSACARCGSEQHLSGFSGTAGGVVCATCEAGSFPFSEAAHSFMVDSLALPMSELPAAGPQAVRQAGRAIAEVLAEHAQVHLSRPEERSAA